MSHSRPHRLRPHALLKSYRQTAYTTVRPGSSYSAPGTGSQPADRTPKNRQSAPSAGWPGSSGRTSAYKTHTYVKRDDSNS